MEDAPGEVFGFSLGQALADAAISFTQIPLNANAPLIPYRDLQASGTYGRGLILPDDIYPVLNHMALTGSKNGAKLATGANVDGAQDVYVVNQSGGGGGGLAPQKVIHNISDSPGSEILPNLMYQLDFTTSAAKYVLAVTAWIGVRDDDLAAAAGGSYFIGLSVNGTSFVNTLFGGYFGPPSSAVASDTALHAMTWSLPLPVPIDIVQSYGAGTGVGLYVITHGPKISAGGCLLYS